MRDLVKFMNISCVDNSESFLVKNFFKIFLIGFLLIIGFLYFQWMLPLSAVLLLCFILEEGMKYGIYWSFFLIPNIRIFDSLGITYLVNILIVIPVVKYLWLALRRCRIPRAAVIVVILFVSEFLHEIYNGNLISIMPSVSWMLGFLLCICISLDDNYKLKKESVYDALTSGIFFSVVVYLAVNISYAGNLVKEVVLGARLAAFANDPNYFCLYILLCMASWINLEKINIYRAISWFCLVGVVLLTASKMGLLLTVFILLNYIFLLFTSLDKKIKKYIVGMLLALVGVTYYFRDILLVLVWNFMERLKLGGGTATLETMTTGRTVILANYMRILSENIGTFIFGTGTDYYLFMGEETGHVAHNTYFDIILSWGITGVFIFSIMIVTWVRAYRQKNGRWVIRYYNVFPVVVIMLVFMALSCLSASMFPFVLLMAIIQLNNIEHKYLSCG